MKRFLVFLGVLAVSCGLWTVDVFAIDPYQGEQGQYGACWTYFGQTTDPTDTMWLPGHDVLNYLSADSTNDPEIWGINLTQYKYLGFEVTTIQADTTLNDSLLVDLWTGYYGHKDSLIAAVAVADITNGTIFDTCTTFPDCPKAIKWVCLADTTEDPPFWLQKYAWLRLRTHITTVFATDSTMTNTVEKDTYAAAGDSMRDWWATNGNDSWETEIDEAIGATDWADFVCVSGKDSLLVCALDGPIAENPGTIDSVVFTVIVKESLDVVSTDTLRLGIAFGDTSEHHFDSLNVGASGSGAIWATQQTVTEYPAATSHDTITYCFTTDPYGNAWTRTTLDSILVIFDPVYVDTVAAGTAGLLKLVQFWAKTYHSRTELFPTLKYRATVWLKE